MNSDEKKKKQLQVSRRQLLRTGVGLAGAGLVGAGLAGTRLNGEELREPRPAAEGSPASDAAAAQSGLIGGVKFEARETVRLGVIGVSSRGTGMLKNFLAVPHV